MCDISVIIVNWNARDHLLRCLNAIAECSTTARMEIIVVDNGSIDGSAEAVEQDFPSVNLIRCDENLGFSRANNIGIGRSRGRYISLVNSDVFVLPGCFQNLTEFMDEHTDVGIVGPKILRPDGTSQKSCGQLPNLRGTLFDAILPIGVLSNSRFLGPIFGLHRRYDGPSEVEMLSGCFWFIRHETLTEVGLLDERFFIYSEDVDWCKRCHQSDWRIMFYPKAEAIHVGAASSSNAPTTFYLEMQKARFSYWEKHHGYWGKAYYATMLFLHEVIQLMARTVLYALKPKQRPKHGELVKRSVACLSWLLRPPPTS